MSRAEDIFQKLIYFGEDAIDEFIINQQTEELFLDFKQAVSVGKNFVTLHRDDRKNLSKAISGFGNSEGGVIIWGVECSRDNEIGDVAKAKVKVKNVHRFLSWLENAISGCTIPSHNKVRNHIISCDKNGDGFIATYIPKSDLAPLMSTTNGAIYIRSGSNNVPAPYSVIAGMFGKRPQPNVELILADKQIKVLDNADEDLIYPLNYGFVEGVMAPDGEWQDAYLMGVDAPVKEFTGCVIAIIKRLDDAEEKWVVAPPGVTFSKQEIERQTHFQEQYFQCEILCE